MAASPCTSSDQSDSTIQCLQELLSEETPANLHFTLTIKKLITDEKETSLSN